MARFKYVDRGQGQFITVNLKEQLLIGSFEWTLDYLIEQTDISIFELNYRNDEKGAAACHPKVLLKIILYCYANGIISSRKIERACGDNIIVKALAEDFEPDHDTIATFISINDEALKDLFVQVLLKCGELKLITGEMFAQDGCKLPSNASKERSGTVKDLKKKKESLEKLLKRIIERHKEIDKSPEMKKIQEPFRETLGDDKERRRRHIERLEKKLEKINTFLEGAEPKKGLSEAEVQSNITDNESALIKGPHGYIQGYNGIAVADAGNQVIIAAEVTGSVSESGCVPEMLDSLNNNMKIITGKKEPLKKSLFLADTGHFTEKNLQEAAKRKINVLIPDPQFRKRDPGFDGSERHKETSQKKYFTVEDFTYDKNDDSFTCPNGQVLPYKCTVEFKKRNTRGKQYRAKKSVCENCKLIDKCIRKRTGGNSLRVLYITEQKYEENLSAKMREKIDNPAYRELYSRRMQIIEPVFANMTYHKKMDHFTLRTRKKVNIQWLLFCIVHNIWKCVKPLAKKLGK
jgi:transposase